MSMQFDDYDLVTLRLAVGALIAHRRAALKALPKSSVFRRESLQFELARSEDLLQRLEAAIHALT